MKYAREKEFIEKEVVLAFDRFARSGLKEVTQKSAFDLVTDIDCNIEKYLSAAIAKAFPKDRIHGEEMSSKNAIEGRTWTIDPIDGTCNMACGIPLYGVQCALFEGGETVLSFVYMPHFGYTLYAVKDEGCYLNGKRTFVKKDAAVNNALLSFGDYPHSNTSHVAARQHTAIRRLYGKVAKIRMFGAACADFAFVASGKTDCTVVITRNVWDIAPGLLLCKEAGARIINLDGEEYKFGDDGVIACANGELAALVSDAFDMRLSEMTGLPKKRYNACIFDFDGVVMDTEKYHFLAWNEACKLFGTCISEEEYPPLKSTGREHILSFVEKKLGRKLSDEEKQKAIKTKAESYEKNIVRLSENDFISGVKDFLEELSRRGVKTAVASSSSMAGELITRYGLGKYFDAVIDSSAGYAKKPAPDIYLAAAEKLMTPRENCLVFEDAPSGVEGGLNAGMDVVAVGGIKNKRAVAEIRDFSAWVK